MRTLTPPAALVLLAAFGVAAPAMAQSSRPTSIAAGAGIMNYDLPDHGTAPAFSVRISRQLPWNLALEGGITHATLDRRRERFPFTTFEAQLQYHIPAGRFTPYFGAGGGLARDGSETPGDHWFPLSFEGWTPTISFAAGTRARINDRIGAFGEVRLRLDVDVRERTTDAIGGVLIRF